MESGNLLFYNKPAGVLSPRKQLDNNKLPSISRAKSPPESSSYAQRNMEHLKQLQEKRMKQQELIEKSRKKEEDEREKLRQLVLEEAARVREQKKQKEIVDKENLDAMEAERKEILAKQKEEEKNRIEEPEKEKDDKTKLYHYYRSRHVSFLHTLKETQKSRKEKEEQEKKKKDEAMNKIRENMGINNVTSKFYDFDKNKEKLADKENNAGRDTVEEITAAYLGKSVKRHERPRSSDQKPLTADSQRVLLDKQKKTLLEIYQKKKDQIQAGEDKEKLLLKQKEKLKEKVLSTMKKEDEDQTKKPRPLSLSLNSLDLETTFTKDKPQKPIVSLPAIKEKQNQENNEQSDPTKVKDTVKPPKNELKKKKSKKKLPTYPNITDMTLWKKRHRLDPETKIFSISGGYGDIKAALEKRGWIENPDINSPCFDFKWTLRGKDIDHGTLLDGQIVNHFDKNTSITTKVGLCKNLRNLIWFNNVDIDTFYPRCFDLSDVHDYEDFIDEFKFCKAESILKQYVNACKNNDPKAKEMELKVQVAATICENKLVDPDELLEDQARLEQIVVSPEEWEIISSDELTQKALALKKHEAWLAKYDITSGPKCAVQKDKTKKKKKRKSKISKANNNKQADGKEGDGEAEAEAENEDENELLDRVESILEEYKTKFPQFGLNGDKNIWIVKPAGLSRGRGISCFKNLVEIQDYVKGKESQWIAQKYMENPMIIHKRKFDIRQWVLVSDWNPLTVWYYEECYVRFSAEEYETENLENKFVHLTNNSIGKYHENQNCSTFEQNMWRMENLIKYMQEQFGGNIFEEQIKPKMKQIVIWALECVQDMVENRKNSHEFYGFDFMIDEDFNVWLIEINSSPDMEYSTPVTKRLVQTVSDDIVKVVVDYNLCKDKKQKKEVDTGGFSLIHQSKRFVEKPLNSFGLDLFLEGKKVGK